MGGGLMQLVAYGAQDVYLTGNPQITFFKVVYRRHTNFAMEAIEQVFMGNVTLGKKTSCTIARNGDLVGRMYLEIDLNTGTNSNDSLDNGIVDRVGHAIIDYVEIEIGGQAVDKHYGEWMDIWSQLTSTQEQFHKLNRLVGGAMDTNGPNKSEALPVSKQNNKVIDGKKDNESIKLYIPLQFWFNSNPGLALPLIALQYHEVKLNVMFKGSSSATSSTSVAPQIDNLCLFCDYIFLDTDERRRFAQVSHEYLINQVQFNGKTSLSGTETTANVDLRFNHPCKEIVWVVQENTRNNPTNANYQPWNYCLGGAAGKDLVNKAVLQLNGHDRFREREGTYFRTTQPYQHHTGLFDTSSNKNKGMFYTYSFALKPEDHQPSGSCNFSRIDNAVLNLDVASGVDARQVRVYATNYNVLRIMSGMGGLAYSN